MRLTWLPDVLRAAGLTVIEDGPRLVDGKMDGGWRTRGSESWGPLRGVICHATASSRTSTPAGDTRVLWQTGSVSAPNPISQLYLARNGDWYVGASGRCNHVLVGDKGPHKGYGNGSLIGIEAANDNLGEPWSAHMLDSYERGVAAICGHEGWPASVAVAHREHQTGKSDPLGIDMTQFRADVQAILTGEDDMTPEQARTQWATYYYVEGLAKMADPIVLPGRADIGYAGYKVPNMLGQKLAEIDAAVDAIAVASGLDVAALKAAVQAAVHAEIPSIADAVVDEQHDRLAE